ncbi:hypothetical protein D3C83_215860 [compost metagenome]
MLTDSEARERLRDAALRRASSFSWTGTARAVVVLYEEVLERPAFAMEAGVA